MKVQPPEGRPVEINSYHDSPEVLAGPMLLVRGYRKNWKMLDWVISDSSGKIITSKEIRDAQIDPDPALLIDLGN